MDPGGQHIAYCESDHLHHLSKPSTKQRWLQNILQMKWVPVENQMSKQLLFFFLYIYTCIYIYIYIFFFFFFFWGGGNCQSIHPLSHSICIPNPPFTQILDPLQRVHHSVTAGYEKRLNWHFIHNKTELARMSGIGWGRPLLFQSNTYISTSSLLAQDGNYCFDYLKMERRNLILDLRQDVTIHCLNCN